MNTPRRLYASPCIVHRSSLIIVILLFLTLGAHQLDLPGLHYDEAKEAGLNAMQLVTWQPLTAFRDATVQIGPWRLPLMVQDYIGALNVLLAAPFLAIGGINTVALRWLSLSIGALTLFFTGRVAKRLGGPIAATATVTLLAANPSFVFWNRQGIFVTNLTALLFMASLLTGLHWWASRRPGDLWLTMFLWGLGIYAKLLFIWSIVAMSGVAIIVWAIGRGRNSGHIAEDQQASSDTSQLANRKRGAKASATTPSSTLIWALALASFLVPLTPLILFNLRTGGTLTSVFSNLGQSYYGVNNSAYLPNLAVRLRQVVTLLRGDHFWYLGGIYANRWGPWMAGGLLIAAVLIGMRGRAAVQHAAAAVHQEGGRFAFLLPMALLVLMVAQSAFTVSDLFITHYALLLPLIPLAGGLAFGTIWGTTRHWLVAGGVLAGLALMIWAGGDLWTTIRYHRALIVSGGHASHSDAIYDLAGYLDRYGLSAPIALDWGMDAQIRFLTAGRVKPVEVFGYTRLNAADPAFSDRVARFLGNPENVYIAHTRDQTVFRGRVEVLSALAGGQGMTLQEETRFSERSGTPLFVVYRVARPPGK